MAKSKTTYKVRNWAEYNKGLQNRGSITFWLSEDAIANWYETEKTGKRGSSPKYSDVAIETMVTMQSIYGLAGRQCVGFVMSLFEMMAIDLSVPDHSTVSRRKGKLTIELSVTPADEARHVVIDATGIKIYGEGEWKTKCHGVSKRRTWRKLHLAVDDKTLEILAVEVTGNDASDGGQLPALVDAIEDDIYQVSADGGYDYASCHEAIAEHHAQAAIPPRSNAKIWQHGNCKAPPHPRDVALRYIRKHGRKKWKRDSHYHQRSLAETAMFRFKAIFSAKASSRKFANQVTELKLKCKLLNQMIQLAKPVSVAVTT